MAMLLLLSGRPSRGFTACRAAAVCRPGGDDCGCARRPDAPLGAVGEQLAGVSRARPTAHVTSAASMRDWDGRAPRRSRSGRRAPCCSGSPSTNSTTASSCTRPIPRVTRGPSGASGRPIESCSSRMPRRTRRPGEIERDCSTGRSARRSRRTLALVHGPTRPRRRHRAVAVGRRSIATCTCGSGAPAISLAWRASDRIGGRARARRWLRSRPGAPGRAARAERAGHPIDVIGGASMGAMVGAQWSRAGTRPHRGRDLHGVCRFVRRHDDAVPRVQARRQVQPARAAVLWRRADRGSVAAVLLRLRQSQSRGAEDSYDRPARRRGAREHASARHLPAGGDGRRAARRRRPDQQRAGGRHEDVLEPGHRHRRRRVAASRTQRRSRTTATTSRDGRRSGTASTRRATSAGTARASCWC